MMSDAPDVIEGVSERRWTGRSRGGRLGNWIFVTLVRRLNLRVAQLLLIPVAFYYMFAARQATRASHDYLQRIGLGKNYLHRLWNTYRHFLTFGKVLLDRLAIIGSDGSRFEFILDGRDHLDAALSEGKGLLIISAHCGGWEMAAHLLRQVAVPVSIVASVQETPQMQRFFDGVFAERAFRVIQVGSVRASFEIMAALARREIVAMHADRWYNSGDMPAPAEPAPFLGGIARFPRGPHMLAAIAGVPLMYTFAMRKRMYHYHFRVSPARRLNGKTRAERDAAVSESVRHFADHLEKVLKEYPLQWFNFYDFWEAAGNDANA